MSPSSTSPSARTQDRIEDEFEFVDAAGRAIADPAVIDRIKLSVLLTKQFTSFLPSAPDPLAALVRFEQLVQRRARRSRAGPVGADALRPGSPARPRPDPRRQHVPLGGLRAPAVRGAAAHARPAPRRTPLLRGRWRPCRARLEAALAGAEDAGDPTEFARRLNEFKDREIYLFDLDHILGSRRRPAPGTTAEEAFETDFLLLSRRLTALAEAVVDAAMAFAWRMAEQPPRRAAHGGGTSRALRHPGAGQARRGGAGVRVRHRGAPGLQRQRVHRRAREHRERGVLRPRRARGAAPRARQARGHLSHRPPPAALRRRRAPRAAAWRASAPTTRAAGRRTPTSGSPWSACGPSAGTATSDGQIERLRDEMVYSAQSIDLAELRELRARQVQEKIRRRTRRPQREVQPRARWWTWSTPCRSCRSCTGPRRSGCARRGSTRRCTPWLPSAWWRSRRRRTWWPPTVSSAG